MSNCQCKRGPVQDRSSSATNGRGHSRELSRYGPSSTRAPTRKPREGVRVWGYTPNTKGGQSGITELLSEQVRLNKRLFAQAKLARLARSEVCSTEAEHLRMVNQSLIDSSPKVSGVENPFLERNLTKAQMVSEELVSRQGRRVIVMGNHYNKPSKPTPDPLRNRGKSVPSSEQKMVHCRPEDWFNLQGPLARYYRRSVVRGYKGSPESWIKGPKAVQLAAKLSRQGFTLPPAESWDVFDPFSPLRWPLNKCPVQPQQRVRTGFSAERINRKATNVVVLRRQASSVTRLKISDWPLVPGTRDQSWPNYPTLNESWIMARREKFPIHHFTSIESLGFTLGPKRPTRLLKAGASARVVTKLVLGVRADVEVPRKFLGYFRYRWGFLILNRYKSSLPQDLVKHLVSIWKRDISQMFLKYPIRYNDALRRLPSSTMFVLGGFVRGSDAPSLSKKKRSRRGKHERLRMKNSKEVCGRIICDRGPSLSDSRGDGVRLC